MRTKHFLLRVEIPPGTVGLPPDSYLVGELEAFAGALLAFHTKGNHPLVTCWVTPAGAARRAGAAETPTVKGET